MRRVFTGWRRLASAAALGFALSVFALVPAARAVMQTGACCLPERLCEDLDAMSCESAGGSFIGFDSSCATVTCDAAAAPLLSGAALLLVTSLLAVLGSVAIRRFRRAR